MGRGDASGSWRTRGPALLICGGAAAILWWLARGERPAVLGPRAVEARSHPGARTPLLPRFRGDHTPTTPAASAGPPGAGPFPVAPEDRPLASPGPGPLIERYRGRSGPLPPGTLARADTIVRTTSLQKEPELLVWVPALRVGPAGTTVFARLQSGRGEVTQLVVELATAPGPDAPARFVPMNPTAGEPRAWSARYRPALAPLKEAGVHTPPPTAIRYIVRARGQLDGVPFTRNTGGIFYLHQPGGQLEVSGTEVVRRGGDLVVGTSALIERFGTYWAYAELWGGVDGDRPVAFARTRLPDLSPGRHPVQLLFGGLIVRESGVDGPYLVRNLQLKQVDTHPPQEADPIAALPATPPWPARDFQ